ncbi:hypothetical protein BDV95DRAFT_327003 [Massariosphaeria phaeospora]|uniref:Uncharacterized protein n=1 Tax=Massariosphaeria phaeospora TaxID=100035 RepID=A0A7C8MBQ8_9PLEO|nr:hypothetical protein BDV95DRAFT_327003 [Massariosphaeria phaeospora]
MTTTPASDLSRSRLRAIATWIRDDLDVMVAREGPEWIPSDDVIKLHDIFQALCSSRTITLLDLRATGIHRAVLEVAGLATRWPGRLADDCDKIIATWTARFGRLDQLHPFLYGRGGRLETIAQADDLSKAGLIKRWQRLCPTKLALKKSHRQGNSGFVAGSWWLTPLLAYHAGIIDLDTTKNGICYDKSCVYAILLLDRDEWEAPTDTTFIYRCNSSKKGRARLCAATPQSRGPIRVLRSHSIHSMWGPKAGVRYDGLYRVTGWSIHQLKSKDPLGPDASFGDIIYDISFQRDDPTPMSEVMSHPTAAEVDDYTEYKRLRRFHREETLQVATGKLQHTNTHAPAAKAAPPIQGHLAPAIQGHLAPKLQLQALQPSPTASRKTTFKVPLPTIKDSKSSSVKPVEEEPPLSPQTLKLRLPPKTSHRPTIQPMQRKSSDSLPRVVSPASSNRSGRSQQSDMREIAPWIEYDS